VGKTHSRLLRSVTIAGLAVVNQLSLGLGAANASEAAESETSSGTTPAPAELRSTGMVVGLGALALMQRERSEYRRVPKMLPLLATPTQHGQLWVGLARERGEAQQAHGVRLQMCWLMPLGQ
jgi:hypothetical protein